MPKAQLKFPANLAKKVKVAATLNNIKMENSKKIGDSIYTDASFGYQNLVDALLMIHQVEGNELDEPSPAKEEKPAKGK